MLNVPSFSEDMLPRHFPKTKGQLEQQSAAAPIPTLPGLSLLLDDDNKVFKTEPTRKIEPKKSFEQWKQQHQAIFIESAATQQRKPEKKQVRFETAHSNEQQSNQRIPTPVSPNLELSYYEGSHEDNFCQNLRQEDYHQQNTNKTGNCNGYEKSVLLPRRNYKPISPSFASDKAYNSQKIVELPHFTHRTVRSESMKENCTSRSNQPSYNEHRQCNRNCCQANNNNWEMMNHQSCNHGMQPNVCVNQRQVHQSHQHEAQSKTISPFSEHVERNLKEQLTDDTLLSIMEEQQQHILLQQSQIMMQQKQNMMQQNQIFMLQHQVQQLLLRNGSNLTESPNKVCQTSICAKPTPLAVPNGLQNVIKTRNGAIDSTRNGATTRSSIGVMTSFLGNVNECVPTGMQQFNERFTTKLSNEKFIENVGGFTTEEYSYKDSMLDKINDAIKNSSAMIDYRNGGNTAANGCVSPNRQSDINIATQALFYETSSTNNGCTTEQKTSDRSFALYMLGMKYDCAQEGAPKNIDKWDRQSETQTNGKTDQVSVNLSPEIYDYLKRHGLLKQE